MLVLSLSDIICELRRGTRVALMVRHAERPKMDPDDPTFGDSIELTYDGCRTAKKLGAALAEFASDVQFCASPLTRTRMTAERIAEGMGLTDPEIPVEDQWGNGSFYYEDALQVLDVFKPGNFFPACFEYFRTGRQRGFRELRAATDACERWIDGHFTKRFFVIATHDLYVAAFLAARGAVEEFTRENWVRFLDGGAILIAPDGSRRYALVRTGLSDGIVGVHRPQIDGVVFDFGGVMTTSTMPERVRSCVGEFGIDWHHLESGFAKYRRLMDGGYLTIEQLYEIIWADADITLPPQVQARILEEDFASFLDGYRNLKTLEWMKELKAGGRKVGILTNMPPAMAPRFREVFADFIAVADAMVISGEVGMFKPQKRIYDLLAGRIGLKPENLCFFDDVETNCDGARRAGWKAIRFESNAQAARDFKKLVDE